MAAGWTPRTLAGVPGSALDPGAGVRLVGKPRPEGTGVKALPVGYHEHDADSPECDACEPVSELDDGTHTYSGPDYSTNHV